MCKWHVCVCVSVYEGESVCYYGKLIVRHLTQYHDKAINLHIHKWNIMSICLWGIQENSGSQEKCNWIKNIFWCSKILRMKNLIKIKIRLRNCFRNQKIFWFSYILIQTYKKFDRIWTKSETNWNSRGSDSGRRKIEQSQFFDVARVGVSMFSFFFWLGIKSVLYRPDYTLANPFLVFIIPLFYFYVCVFFL